MAKFVYLLTVQGFVLFAPLGVRMINSYYFGCEFIRLMWGEYTFYYLWPEIQIADSFQTTEIDV